MTAEQFIFVIAQLAFYCLAVVGVLVVGGTALTWARDQHGNRMARVAAYTGGPLHLTIRHHRSTRG